MQRLDGAAVLCGLLMIAAGCGSTPPQHDFRYDNRGWGGPDLKYAVTPLGNVIRLDSGMLVNRDFRWAEEEFSFEFLDSRDLVWGIRLLDLVFRPARRQQLCSGRQLFATASGEFVVGNRLSPSEYWRLWEHDRVLDLAFVPDKQGQRYKILVGSWKEAYLENGLKAVEVGGTLQVNIHPDIWNTFSAKIVRGQLTYTVNGQPGPSPIRLDPRSNGQLGIFVRQGGPLCIRNLKLQ